MQAQARKNKTPHQVRKTSLEPYMSKKCLKK
jgi:hypothetical protein